MVYFENARALPSPATFRYLYGSLRVSDYIVPRATALRFLVKFDEKSQC